MFPGVNCRPCHHILLVIINNLYVRRASGARLPFKTNPPLVVNSYAVLPSAIALQGFETVARQYSQIPQRDGRLQAVELQARRMFDTREHFDLFAEGEVPDPLVPIAA